MNAYELIINTLKSWYPAKNASIHITRLGGLTNLNYKVDVEDQQYVFHFAGKNRQLLGINSAHEYQTGAIAAFLGIGPSIIFYNKNKAVLVTNYIPGHELSSNEIFQNNRLKKVINNLHTIHDSSLHFPGVFVPFAVIKKYYSSLLNLGVKLPPSIEEAIAGLHLIEKCYEKPRKLCNCHNDLLAANLIETEKDNIHILDWEYAGLGDRCFDLANFAAHFELDNQMIFQLSTLYCGREDAVFYRRILLMRAVSNLREALWGFIQAAISQLDIDYAAYANCFLHRFFQNLQELKGDKHLVFTPDSNN